MSLLSSIFGSSKKTTTTATTTNATQTSIDNSGGVYATGSTLDLSSVTNTDSRVFNDARNMSTTNIIDPSADVMAEIARFSNAQNMAFLESVTALNRNGYEVAGRVFDDAIDVVSQATQSDGQRVLDTVENLTKYIVIGVAALGAFAVLGN